VFVWVGHCIKALFYHNNARVIRCDLFGFGNILHLQYLFWIIADCSLRCTYLFIRHLLKMLFQLLYF